VVVELLLIVCYILIGINIVILCIGVTIGTLGLLDMLVDFISDKLKYWRIKYIIKKNNPKGFKVGDKVKVNHILFDKGTIQKLGSDYAIVEGWQIPYENITYDTKIYLGGE